MKTFLKIIGLLLALILLYFLLTHDDSFNTVDLSHSSNVVNNYSSISYLDTLTHLALVELDVEGAQVNIIDGTNTVLNNIIPDTPIDGFVHYNSSNKIHSIFVNKNMSRSDYIDMMAHEAIHIQQYEEGRLEMLDYPYVVFEGDTLNSEEIRYRVRPWEEEAYNNQRSVQKRLYNILY